MAIKIDKNMQSSGKSNIHGYTRPLIPPKQQHIRAKDSTNHMQETYDKKMKKMNDRMEALQADYANQLKKMQNRVINMERAQTSQNNFPPKGHWVQRKFCTIVKLSIEPLVIEHDTCSFPKFKSLVCSIVS